MYLTPDQYQFLTTSTLGLRPRLTNSGGIVAEKAAPLVIVPKSVHSTLVVDT